MKLISNRLVASVLIPFLASQWTVCNVVVAIEATWTPVEEDGNGGPLPLSQNHRNQLTQLDQAISSSPNPTQTLKQVAEANQMDPKELYDLLMRNRRDMQSADQQSSRGAGIAMNTFPLRIMKLLQSFFLVLFGYARRDPKRFGTILSILFASWYFYYTVPRTGVVLSSTNRLLLSSGFTTLFEPPKEFVLSYLQRQRGHNLLSFSRDVNINLVGDDSLKDNKYSVTCRKLVPINDLQQLFEKQQKISLQKGDTHSNAIEFKDDNIQSAPSRGIDDLIYESACNVVRQRRFDEFKSSKKHELVAFYSLLPRETSSKSRLVQQYSRSKITKNQLAAVIVLGMGDFGRYGIQPLQQIYEFEDENDSVSKFSVGFATLKNGHFDGELAVSVTREARNPENETDSFQGVSISVSIVIPSNGRMSLSKKLCTKITQELCQSLLRSAVMDARRHMAQHIQSSSYHDKTNEMATERRRAKTDNIAKMEAMDENRRRRWQRQNPNSGHYRPSGERMRSPNNC